MNESWIMRAGREESTLSAVVLGIGANLLVLPIAGGLMTIFYWGFSAADLAVGSALIAVGLAAVAGLYLARMNPVFGVALIAGSMLAMAFLATWALPGIMVIGLALVVMAVVRRIAPPPTPAMAS